MGKVGVLLLVVAAPIPAVAQAVFVDTTHPQPQTQTQTTTTGQDAISQLEAIGGGKIDRTRVDTSFKVPRPRPKPKPVGTRVNVSNQIATNLMGGILDNLFSDLLASGSKGQDAAELARLEAERKADQQRQQAELQAWANSYCSHMNAMVGQQRQQRSAENQASMESLKASLSDGWDTPKPGGAVGGLAADLADPLPEAVDLRGSATLTPSLLREADGRKRTSPITADELLKRRQDAQARLQRMMEENKDLRLLGQRFYELEAELQRLKRQAGSLGTEGRIIQREMDYVGWRIDQATQACLERGTSLLTDTLLPKGTEAAMLRLKKNPKLWNQTLQSFSDINEFSEFTSTLGDRYDAAGQALDWFQAKRNLMKDIDFIASNVKNVSSRLEPLSLHWEVGKTLVGTSVDLAAELDGWGAILERQGDTRLLLQKQQALGKRIEVVVEELQRSRSQLAARLGVKPEDLIPSQAKPRGLGSVVPPL